MINSGLNTPILLMLIPLFAVPYAAPAEQNTIANVIPIIPKNGAHGGQSGVAMIPGYVAMLCEV